MMKIILQEDVPHLGVVGDLVTVKDGFGRNFLIPQGKAILASPRSVRELDHQKRLAAHKRTLATEQAQSDKNKLEGLSICVQAKVAPPSLNEMGEPILDELQKLFGSITSREIAKIIESSGVKVDHRKVSFKTAIRTVGKFEAKVRLNGGISATLPFWVVPEGTTDLDSEKKRVEESQVQAGKKAIEAAEAAAKKAAEIKASAEAAVAAAKAAAEADAAGGDEAEATEED